MAYEYDVFLSYRRYKEWPTWVKEKFLPIFDHWLGEHLGREAQIFIDDYEIDTGMRWPEELAHSLAASRILVPLWSRQYFNSTWCQLELSHMLAREQMCESKSLVIPAIIHDGKSFPSWIQNRVAMSLTDCVNIRMAKGSPTEEMLSKKIDTWVLDIEKAIQRAPAYDPQWEEIAVEEFMRRFEDFTEPKQLTIPSQAGS